MSIIDTLDDTICDYQNIKQTLPYCKFEDLYTKNDLQIIYTNQVLSSFLDVPVNTKTNIYTILKRVRLYIDDNNLCINGVIKPDEKLSNILVSTHKYNRIIHNTLSKYLIL